MHVNKHRKHKIWFLCEQLLLCFWFNKPFVLLWELKHNGMSSVKIISASQARSFNLHKNLSTKVMKCCANIYYNQQCLIKKIIPNYTKIKISYTSPATETTKEMYKQSV